MKEVQAAIAWRLSKASDSVGGGPTCFKALSHSSPNPALLWALSVLDLCSPATYKPFPCFTQTFSSVWRHHPQDFNLKLHLPSYFLSPCTPQAIFLAPAPPSLGIL